MRKEWLEFLGGLFVFLGALVPVFRAGWRSLKRTLTPTGLILFFLTIAVFVVGVFVLVGLVLRWPSNVESGLLILYIFGSVVAFLADSSPLNRINVGLLVMSLVFAASILGAQLARTLPESTQKAVTTPTPSATSTPSN